MAMFIADDYLPLEEADHYTRAMAGAELNVSVGLERCRSLGLRQAAPRTIDLLRLGRRHALQIGRRGECAGVNERRVRG